MTRGSLGTINLNRVIQERTNPPAQGKPQVQVGSRIFRVGDRVIHRKNNYDLGVFNGDIGVIRDMDTQAMTLTISFFPDHRYVVCRQADLVALDLAYAVTIHKSQGSEFETVIIPMLTQHYMMLFRNLIYTGITRAKKLAVFVGTRRALSMAVRNQDISRRQTALEALIRGEVT
ncbi:MAG: ATP-dependent RecD-like DNA helicase, partial [Desulfobacterales bacterium]|nr:ATP-dependent RecD-like DNA helicase [Desulfobacterales bacterium]